MAAVLATRSSRWGRRPAPGTSWRPGSEPSLAPRTRTPLPGSLDLRCEEGGGFYQDLALGLQLLHLPAQPLQLLALLRRQAVLAHTVVALGLLDPVPHRLAGHPELAADLVGVPAGTHQGYGLASELRRIRGLAPRHLDILLHKRSGVHETGRTPPGGGA